MKPIQHILIVGGGTAGWLTAAFLARTLGTAAGGLRVTLVESSEIGIIGVGEGTFPSIRGTLHAIGLDEARFVRECDATFKQGVNFVDWSGVGERYFHPFNAPSQRPGAPELLPYWLLGEAGDRARSPTRCRCSSAWPTPSRAPKRASDGDWLGPDELRVPLRRRQVRHAAGHARAVAGRRAHDRDGRARRAARGRPHRRRRHARPRRAGRRPLRRLHRLPRAADRRGAGRRPQAVGRRAVRRPRARAAGALPACRHAHPVVHDLHRARGRLDVGHRPAPAPRRRLRLLEPPRDATSRPSACCAPTSARPRSR